MSHFQINTQSGITTHNTQKSRFFLNDSSIYKIKLNFKIISPTTTGRLRDVHSAADAVRASLKATGSPFPPWGSGPAACPSPLSQSQPAGPASVQGAPPPPPRGRPAMPQERYPPTPDVHLFVASALEIACSEVRSSQGQTTAFIINHHPFQK